MLAVTTSHQKGGIATNDDRENADRRGTQSAGWILQGQHRRKTLFDSTKSELSVPRKALFQWTKIVFKNQEMDKQQPSLLLQDIGWMDEERSSIRKLFY